MSMDWTPEQIAAAALAVTPVYCRHHGKHAPCVLCLAEARDIAEGVLSAVDLSDHDRAVAADALRQAADAAADNCARALNDDDPTEANRWADTEHWLRARAEGQVPDGG